MKKRIELKYYMNVNNQEMIKNDLEKFFIHDSFNIKKLPYKICSIYYDNYYLKSYHEKLDGNSIRSKLRIRFYKNSDTKFFNIEFKNKYGNFVLKNNLKIPIEYLDDFLKGNFLKIIKKTQNDKIFEFIDYIKMYGLKPIIIIEYDRTAYFSKTDKDVRVTIDQNIYFSKYCLNYKNLINPVRVFNYFNCILEIKSPNYVPFYLLTIIKKYNLKLRAISKYANAIKNKIHTEGATNFVTLSNKFFNI